MKLGVAIPCYHGHIQHLHNLLDSIDSQTVLPDKVVVSSSSTEKIEITRKYKFPIFIIITPDKKSAAQNRNIAIANLMDMDYVTFIDADDIMHPQRIEILLTVISQYDSDIILHNYSTQAFDKNCVEKFDSIDVRIASLVQSYSGCITHIGGYDDRIDKIHHSQVTVKKCLFNTVKFPEEPEFHLREDCVFCFRIFSIPNIKNAYVQNELSYYTPSKTGGIS